MNSESSRLTQLVNCNPLFRSPTACAETEALLGKADAYAATASMPHGFLTLCKEVGPIWSLAHADCLCCKSRCEGALPICVLWSPFKDSRAAVFRGLECHGLLCGAPPALRTPLLLHMKNRPSGKTERSKIRQKAAVAEHRQPRVSGMFSENFPQVTCLCCGACSLPGPSVKLSVVEMNN